MSTEKFIKPGSKASRSFEVSRAAINQDARTVELAFSSEQPYERWWGVEILDHQKKSIRLGRLKKSGPLLMDHDSRDHIGVIEEVRIDSDLVGRAVVRFGKSARASEVFQDVIDGIRTSVSVGYIIHAAKMVAVNDNVETYRVTDWEPYEVSLVSVPADTAVGVGRADESLTAPNSQFQIMETKIMADPVADTKPAAVQPVDEGAIAQRAREDYRKEDLKRTDEIIAIGEQFSRFGADKMAAEALRRGDSVATFRAAVLQKISEAPKPSSDIGMSQKEVRQFSFLRAMNALANPNDARAQQAAAFEREVSNAGAQAAGKQSQGIYIPSDVLRDSTRDLNVTTATAGGNLVATELLAGASFIELLRHRLVLMGMGAQMLSGLVGNIAIARQSGAATAYWVAESGSPTESQGTFDQVTMSPKTLGAFSDISRKLLLQASIDVEMMARMDFIKVLALELQRVGINGSGTAPEPRGILNVAGIGSVAGGTNGLAPTWDHIVGLETEVAIDNADVGSLGYLTNAKVRGKAKRTFIDSPGSGQRLWDNGTTPLNGYQCGVTNAVPSNLTKGSSSGVCSAIIFGNFNELIYGMWGGLDLMLDPYTGSTSGTVRIVALQDVDLCVRHAESFAAMVDALTV